MIKEFDIEEMALFDGKDGKQSFIVHQGKVYDVSDSRLWKGGLHMKRHHAGQDLSVDIGAAPHGPEVLERYPQIGVIRPREAAERAMPEPIRNLLERYPMLRRHPHPMTVHFPIVFLLSCTFFNVLYLLTGARPLETTALHCLGAGILFLPIVILTGLFSWWLNYMARPLKSVAIKALASTALFVLAILAFTWRIAVPGILDTLSPASFFYFLLILSFAPLVGIIGWYGAQLTFPIERD